MYCFVRALTEKPTGIKRVQHPVSGQRGRLDVMIKPALRLASAETVSCLGMHSMLLGFFPGNGLVVDPATNLRPGPVLMALPTSTLGNTAARERQCLRGGPQVRRNRHKVTTGIAKCLQSFTHDPTPLVRGDGYDHHGSLTYC